MSLDRVVRLFSPEYRRSARPELDASDASSAARGSSDVNYAKLIERADRFRDAAQYQEAAEAYRSIIEMAPDRADLRVQYGNMLKDMGRLAEAEAAYRAALPRAPDHADVYLQLGHTLKLQGRRSEALEAYLHAAALAPFAVAPRHELFQMGHRSTQEQFFEKELLLGVFDTFATITQKVVDLQNTLDRLLQSLPDVTANAATPVGCYEAFRARYDVPVPPGLTTQLRFGIILLADDELLENLHAQIRAVAAQSNQNWTLHVIGSDPAKRRVVEQLRGGDTRIAWLNVRDSKCAVTAEWRVGSSLGADWLVLCATGAVLHPNAIAWFAAAAEVSSADAFVLDEELDSGCFSTPGRLSPRLRQVVDYDTLLEANVFGETLVVRTGAYAGLSSLAESNSVTMARTLALLSLAKDGRVGHLSCMLVRRYLGSAPDPVQPELEHERAVRMHLSTCKEKRVEVGSRNSFGLLSIRWRTADPAARISVIIPTRDNSQDLRGAIDSLKATASLPDSLEFLIVDNGSREKVTHTNIDALAAEGSRVIEIDETFNWSRLNNQAVKKTTGALLAFINDDVQMLTERWDERLRGFLERPEIGAVGARLLYPDNSLQHGGILFRWPGWLVAHDGRHEPGSEPGPTWRWHVTRTVSAVTGAFLATRRDVFVAHNGFDEVNLPVAYSDVDYALKLRQSGLRILWTPHITLYHFESKTRGLDDIDPEKSARNRVEQAVMRRRWGAVLDIEPSLNPSWHNATVPFRLLSPPSQVRLLRHIEVCAARNPWMPANEAASESERYWR